MGPDYSIFSLAEDFIRQLINVSPLWITLIFVFNLAFACIFNGGRD